MTQPSPWHRIVAMLMLAFVSGTGISQGSDELDALFGDNEPERQSQSSESDARAPDGTDADTPPDELETIPVPPVETAEPRKRPNRQLEEIVVTAQKREQAIQDVPISMTALTGDFLKEQGVSDISEALGMVPNASIDAAGFFAAPRIRRWAWRLTAFRIRGFRTFSRPCSTCSAWKFCAARRAPASERTRRPG